MGHGEGPQGSLEGHQGQGEAGDPRQPGGQPSTEGYPHANENQQGHPHHKGIQAVEPFQEDLDIHLLARQKAAVTEGPIWAGQTRFHHPGGPANRHQRHQGHNQMGGQQGETVPQLKIWRNLKIWR